MELEQFKKINGNAYTFKEIWDIYDKQFTMIRDVLLSMGDKYVVETIPKSNDKTIKLTNKYTKNQLFLYVNGVIQWKDVNYKEIDGETIELLFDRDTQDDLRVVIIKSNVMADSISNYIDDLRSIVADAKKCYGESKSLEDRLVQLHSELVQQHSIYSQGKLDSVLEDLKNLKSDYMEYRMNALNLVDTLTKVKSDMTVLSSIISLRLEELDEKVASEVTKQLRTFKKQIDDTLAEYNTNITKIKKELTKKIEDTKTEITNSVRTVLQGYEQKMTEFKNYMDVNTLSQQEVLDGNIDLNSEELKRKSGFYLITSTAPIGNAPFEDIKLGTLVVKVHAGNRAIEQEFRSLNGEMSQRTFKNSTWTSWYTPITLPSEVSKDVKDGITTGDTAGKLLWNMLHSKGENFELPTENAEINKLGIFSSYYNVKDKFKNQPAQYGQLINFPAAQDQEGTQIWISQDASYRAEGIRYRCGNAKNKMSDQIFRSASDIFTLKECDAILDRANSPGDKPSAWVRDGVPYAIKANGVYLRKEATLGSYSKVFWVVSGEGQAWSQSFTLEINRLKGQIELLKASPSNGEIMFMSHDNFFLCYSCKWAAWQLLNTWKISEYHINSNVYVLGIYGWPRRFNLDEDKVVFSGL
jgi:hypothetical protein|nr:MAG TPA: hypothetical protein [Bacteriophage sp.]